MKKIIIKTLFFLLCFSTANSETKEITKQLQEQGETGEEQVKQMPEEENVKTIFEGNVDAKIKLIVFESLTCVHCANFHKDVYPNLKKDFIDKEQVYIEFRSFPLNIVALNAAKLAHCKNDGSAEILHYLYKNQSQWLKGSSVKEVDNYLKIIIDESNFNLNFDQCINNKQVEDHILIDRIEGTKKFKIKATPTLIINGEEFEKPLNYKKLKKYLEKLI